jgi:hypothetical protein
MNLQPLAFRLPLLPLQHVRVRPVSHIAGLALVQLVLVPLAGLPWQKQAIFAGC